MDATRAAAALIRAHARRSLSRTCRCSPTTDPDHDTAILWSPDHVAEHLHAAGLLATEPLDLDATARLTALSDPRSTLNP